MFAHQPNPNIPPDKFIQQLLLQALQAYYNNDSETGNYYLEQIASNLPRFMYNLHPTLKGICKDIVKITRGGSLVKQKDDFDAEFSPARDEDISPALDELSSSSPKVQVQSNLRDPFTSEEATPPEKDRALISELSQTIEERKNIKKKKLEDDLTGSLDDLDDFDF